MNDGYVVQLTRMVSTILLQLCAINIPPPLQIKYAIQLIEKMYF